jgi:DNA-binding winged helix-turn-helix (wHTH) protein/TolB-like protein/tetratricopeptide (TPR) repeat protein
MLKSATSDVGNAPFRVENHLVDPRLRRLSGPDGKPIPLSAKAFDALLYLITHRDRIVGKDELLAQVWPGRVVEENNLTQAISSLRKAFGTGAGDHRYVLTVAGRGYRWVAALQPEHSDDAAVADPASAPGTQPPPAAEAPPPAPAADGMPRRPAFRIALATAGLLVLGLLAAWAWRPVPPAPPAGASAEAADGEPAMLAVLPFRTVAGEPRDDLLVLGLAESLIVRLSANTGLRVSSLGSVARFATAEEDPLVAARALGATYVVEGSTQRQGEQVRVSVRLLRAPEGDTLWADTFDAGIGEAFRLQDRMADAVVQALSLRLTETSAAHRSPCDGDDPAAYRAYLGGRDLMMAPSAERLQRAILAFRQALDLDPTCARAWAGQAFAWRALAITGDADPAEAFPLVRAAIERALALDPLSAEAYSSLAFVEFWHEWDWEAAEAAARRAVWLNPSLAESRLMLAHLLVNLGRFDEGLEEVRAARAVDPLSPLLGALEAGFLTAAGRRHEARAQIERALLVAPDFWIALLIRGSMALDDGNPAEAIADLDRAVQRSGQNSLTLAMLGMALAASGDRPRAEIVLGQLRERAVEGYVPASSLASVELALGNRDAALALLERGLQQRDVRMSFIGIDARWNPIREEPRFRAIAQQLGLPVDPAHGRF